MEILEDQDAKIVMDHEEEAKNPLGNIFKNIVSGENAKNYIRWALYAIKAEITINELRFCLYWITLVEIFLITFSTIILAMQGSFIIFLHLLHFFRPILCIKLISNLPRSHDIFEELPGLSDANIMQPVIYAHFQRANGYFTKYVVLSFVCIILDIVGCIISFTIFSTNRNADFLYGIAAWVLLCFDCFMIFWYNTLRWMYPDVIWQNIRSILKSGLYNAQAFLSEFTTSLRNRFRSN
jgi:hypothetical protein